MSFQLPYTVTGSEEGEGCSIGTQMGRKSVEMFETEALKSLAAATAEEKEEETGTINPSWLSAVFMAWTWPILKAGKVRELTMKDLPQFANMDKSRALEKRFDAYWRMITAHLTDPVKVKIPSLALYLVYSIRREILLACFWNFLSAICMITFPLFLQKFMLFVADDTLAIEEGLLSAVILVVSAFISLIATNTKAIYIRSTSNKIQSLLSTAIIKKRLVLSAKATMIFSESAIISLTEQYAPMVSPLLEGFLGFVSIIYVLTALSFLYHLLGFSAIAGSAFSVICIMFMSFLSSYISVYMGHYAEANQGKVKMFLSYLKNSTVSKCLGVDFEQYYHNCRIGESAAIARMVGVLTTTNIFGENIAPIISCVFFGVYATTGNALIPSIVFPALLFMDLGGPTKQITATPKIFTAVRIGCEAIEKFLAAEESLPQEKGCDVCCYSMDMTIFRPVWSYEGSVENASQFTLSSPKFLLPSSGFIGVSGEVGFGKSTFLKGILGLVPLISASGKVKFHGKFSYAPQQPHIFSGSVKDNITFSSEIIDTDRLALVIRCCALEKDLSLLSEGWNTLLGEGGVGLSGGQKARVSLARSLYHEADVYLLDDPLSSCDPKVSRYIFSSIKSFLKNKRVLFATHSLQHLSEMDYIISLSNGTVSEFGKTEDILATEGGQFSSLMASFQPEINVVIDSDRTLKMMALDGDSASKNSGQSAEEVEDDEEITLQTFKNYISELGTVRSVFVALSFIFNTFATTGYLLWIANWSYLDLQNDVFVIIYILLALASAAGSAATYFVVFYCSRALSSRLSDEASLSILGAKNSFIESNHSGRIINRVSNDVLHTERDVPVWIGLVLSTSSIVTAQAILITCSNPLLIFLIMGMFFLSHSIYVHYGRTSVKVQRILSISASRFNSVMNETLMGADLITIFRKEDISMEKFQEAMDEYLSIQYIFASLTIWFQQRVCTCAVVIVAVCTIAGFYNRGPASSALIGLALSNAYLLGWMLDALLSFYSKLCASMNSFQRLTHYGSRIPQEAPRTLSSDPLKKDWPTAGLIEFKDLTIAYERREAFDVIKELSVTIKELSVTIQPGEKIGVVGRTGAGKSTLISAIFRLVDAKEGAILIDGLDIHSLGLNTLRKRIQIIPQEAVLFEGTVRSNLLIYFSDDGERGENSSAERGRLSEGDDVNLWQSLEQAGIKGYVQGLEGQLDAKVLSEGSNFSHGQRQLLCLARAIICKPKILIMDEATASIDAAADERIQTLIKTQFKDTTVISIAHRLASVSYYDKIMVLSEGRLVEFGSPSQLLLNPDSFYYQMVAASSSGEASSHPRVTS